MFLYEYLFQCVQAELVGKKVKRPLQHSGDDHDSHIPGSDLEQQIQLPGLLTYLFEEDNCKASNGTNDIDRTGNAENCTAIGIAKQHSQKQLPIALVAALSERFVSDCIRILPAFLFTKVEQIAEQRLPEDLQLLDKWAPELNSVLWISAQGYGSENFNTVSPQRRSSRSDNHLSQMGLSQLQLLQTQQAEKFCWYHSRVLLQTEVSQLSQLREQIAKAQGGLGVANGLIETAATVQQHL